MFECLLFFLTSPLLLQLLETMTIASFSIFRIALELRSQSHHLLSTRVHEAPVAGLPLNHLRFSGFQSLPQFLLVAAESIDIKCLLVDASAVNQMDAFFI